MAISHASRCFAERLHELAPDAKDALRRLMLAELAFANASGSGPGTAARRAAGYRRGRTVSGGRGARDRGAPAPAFGQNANKLICGPDGAPAAVRFPNGEVLTRAELLAPRASGRWTPKLRRNLVAAVAAGLIAAAEARAAHQISAEEWAEWALPRRAGACSRRQRERDLARAAAQPRAKALDWICARPAASRRRSAEAARRVWRRRRETAV